MKRNLIIILLVAIGSCLSLKAQTPTQARSWGKVATGMPAEWYGSPESVTVAENVLIYQNPKDGGWPKNKPMHKPIPDEELKQLRSDNGSSEFASTIDNNATTMEMKFMAKMYNATKDAKYKESFMRGLNYIIAAQYTNGGWPQFYPLVGGYHDHITYNDDAMVNVMKLLRDIFNGKPEYAFVSESDATKAFKAFDKGVNCILKTQIVRNGEPTVWCAQHHETTLAPAKARAYELPSFSGAESSGIVLLLMDIPNPSPEIVRSIEGAVKWFESHKIMGLKYNVGKDASGQVNREIVEDPNATALWGRFYDLDNEKPFFCGRDGIKKWDVQDIEYERRNGYGWYTEGPQKVLDTYVKWEKKNNK